MIPNNRFCLSTFFDAYLLKIGSIEIKKSFLNNGVICYIQHQSGRVDEFHNQYQLPIGGMI